MRIDVLFALVIHEVGVEDETMKLLAADCGGTRIKLGLVENRILVADDELEAHSGQPIKVSLDAVADRLEWMCRARAWSLSDCDGILIALPLIISPDQTTVTRSFGKFDDAIGFDFPSWARERLGLPLLLENDARAAAIAEWDCGAGRGVRDMAMVTLGTGIGTAVICGGMPLRGRSGLAGNLGGHTATHAGGEACPCGIDGCLEAQVATWALPGFLRKDPEFAASPLASEKHLDYEAVFRHAAEGDALACRFRDRALRAWAALLVNLVHAYEPERIVLGGGIMRQADFILGALRELVDRQATQPGSPVELVAVELGVSAALLAAPWLHEQASGLIQSREP